MRKHFVVLGLVVSFFVSFQAESAPPEFKIYEYITQLVYPEGRVDLRIEMRISTGREDFADECTLSIKNSASNEWLPIHDEKLIRFSKVTYTRDLSPGVKVREWLIASPADGNPKNVRNDLGIAFQDSDLRQTQLYRQSLKSRIEDEFSAIAKGATALPESPRATAKAPVKTKNSILFYEGDREFALTFEKNDAVLSSSDGKSVRFAKEGVSLNSLHHIEDGILYLTGTARIFDLRMFDAEVSFIGNTTLTNSVQRADGGMAEPETEFNRLYPDLVKKERELIEKKLAAPMTEEASETVLRIARSLRLNKSVKLLGPAGSGKTSEMKALARLIAAGKIPSIPRTAQIRVISLNSLASGTKYVGEIEQKIAVILEYASTARPILLIDEFHVASGVGVSQGNPNNIAQALKPYLEDGSLRMVGISTNQEWDNAFANDAAFDQRFEEVTHAEPKGEELRQKVRNSFVLRGLPVPGPDAIERAIVLSDRFAISGAQPRKAVNLLIKATGIMDEMGQVGAPANVQSVESAAVESYQIDPTAFDRAKIQERLANMRQVLESQIVGQREAIEKMSQVWFRKLTGVGSSQTANAILFFGPPGTGKTLTARLSAQAGGFKSMVIEMNKYANGDVEAFRYEVFRALRGSPNTVIILDEIEKAHPKVQNATLAMMQPGQFTVNFEDQGGRKVFEEVNSSNAIFVLTTNAGQSLFTREAPRAQLGYRPVPIPTELPGGAQATSGEITATLVRDGISEPLLSRIEAVVGMARPSAGEFRTALAREIQATLARESEKVGVTFRLSNQEALIEKLMTSYQPNASDYRDVGALLRENLDPLIAQAIIEPGIETARVIRIDWSPLINVKDLPSAKPCDFLLRKINRPLGELGRQ